ncbi:hypothetical protein [Nonomuraea thailandensis]
MTEREEERIWCEVRLNDVAGVFGSYELWKDGPWYHRVDWQRVCEAFGGFLQRNAMDGVVTDLPAQLRDVEDRLGQHEREGLLALVLEPITRIAPEEYVAGPRPCCRWPVPRGDANVLGEGRDGGVAAGRSRVRHYQSGCMRWGAFWRHVERGRQHRHLLHR